MRWIVVACLLPVLLALVVVDWALGEDGRWVHEKSAAPDRE